MSEIVVVFAHSRPALKKGTGFIRNLSTFKSVKKILAVLKINDIIGAA
jgi:hypothetical protein